MFIKFAFVLAFQLVQADPTVAVITNNVWTTTENPWAGQKVEYVKESAATAEITRLQAQVTLTADDNRRLEALKLAVAQVEGIREAWIFPCPGHCRPQPDSAPNFK